ncbi:MAG TPA: DUF4868 domain-containing protein [Leptospiraceae bacterium]|nr:DUF4868 domain-containing protein [Leptospiraceae bacterium]HNK90777.1 DUF4868 domain-containing protein [Chitinophagales bacterium]HMZ67038.1 DUF4868 domain-containing protein [Leptospiraceae bacterium]HNA10243.1 DUF4868 domain-containing protein [Leptospiraceae bacterium]HNC59565.1 DUF4868 domain-containing protein [Leptospiraceae bacterium]
MISNSKEIFSQLSLLEFSKFTLEFWIIKEHKNKRESIYEAFFVMIDDSFREKIIQVVNNIFKNKNFILKEYSHEVIDNEEEIMFIDSKETEISQIIEKTLDKESDEKKVKDINELSDTWAYLIKLSHKNSEINFFKKLNRKWKIEKSKKEFFYSFFKNKMITALKEEDVIQISKTFDYIDYNGIIYILNKRNFETALNFRKGMEKNRDSLITELNELSIVENLDDFKEAIGNNLHLLRKASMIKKSQYYKDENFMKKLMEVNKKNKWGLTFKNNRIVFNKEKDKIEEILSCLNDDRLESPITLSIYDVQGKRKVQ